MSTVTRTKVHSRGRAAESKARHSNSQGSSDDYNAEASTKSRNEVVLQVGTSKGSKRKFTEEEAAALFKQVMSGAWPASFRRKLRKACDTVDSLFTVAPCRITEAQVKLRYGLMEQSGTMPLYDRFQTLGVAEETLRKVGALIASDVCLSAMVHRFPTKESQASAILDRVLCALTFFTAERESAFHLEYAEDDDVEEEEEEDETTTSPSTGKEDLEVQAQEPDPISPRWHSDVLGFVYADRHAVDGKQLKFAADFKTIIKLRDLLQAFIYSDGYMKSQTVDLTKEFRPPVYLLAMDTCHWMYGIAEVDGYVEVDSGELVPESLESFPDQAATLQDVKYTAAFTKTEVQAKFSAWKSKLARKHIDIPDGLYPVGRLFRNNKRFPMPSFSPESEFLPLGAQRFYAGLLKILVGSSVTKWTVDEATKRYKKRKHALKRRAHRNCRSQWKR